MARQVRVAGHDSRVDEGAGEENESGGIAARIADPRHLADFPALMPVELGQSVDPAVRDPVRGARVEHPHVVARHETHRLARRVVGKAEDHDVGLVEIPAAHLRVLARRLRNLDERHIPARRKPLADLQPGRAGLPVDEYVRHWFQSRTVHCVPGERTANPAPVAQERRSHAPPFPPRPCPRKRGGGARQPAVKAGSGESGRSRSIRRRFARDHPGLGPFVTPSRKVLKCHRCRICFRGQEPLSAEVLSTVEGPAPPGCHHCGAPLGHRSPVATVAGREVRVCGDPCRTAVETIANAGLAAWYELRTHSDARGAATADPRHRAEIDAWRVPEVEATLVRRAGDDDGRGGAGYGTSAVTLTVEGDAMRGMRVAGRAPARVGPGGGRRRRRLPSPAGRGALRCPRHAPARPARSPCQGRISRRPLYRARRRGGHRVGAPHPHPGGSASPPCSGCR